MIQLSGKNEVNYDTGGGHSIISGESINVGARGTLFDAFASSFNRGRTRNRYLHAVRSNCQPAVRVSLDISMNKVTSVTLNFRAPRSILPVESPFLWIIPSSYGPHSTLTPLPSPSPSTKIADITSAEGLLVFPPLFVSLL